MGDYIQQTYVDTHRNKWYTGLAASNKLKKQ